MTQYLALASADRVWTLDPLQSSVLSAFQPNCGVVRAVVWNHNSQVLASTGDGGIISLNLPNGSAVDALPHEQELSSSLHEEIKSLGFTSTSRHMFTGGTLKVIKLWDLKKRSLQKILKGHTGIVTCASMCQGDSGITSGSISGEIIVHHFDESWSETRLNPKDFQKSPVMSIQASPFSRNQIVCSCEDGTIRAWDIASQSIECEFPLQHNSVASAAVLSPLNPIFLASAGLDRKIVFYDLSARRIIQSIVVNDALSSLCFKDDGVTVAVGSNDGKVYTYDLRNTVQYTSSYDTSTRMPVTSLSFQSFKHANRKQSTAPTPSAPSAANANTILSSPDKNKISLTESMRESSQRTQSTGLSGINKQTSLRLSDEKAYASVGDMRTSASGSLNLSSGFTMPEPKVPSQLSKASIQHDISIKPVSAAAHAHELGPGIHAKAPFTHSEPSETNSTHGSSIFPVEAISSYRSSIDVQAPAPPQKVVTDTIPNKGTNSSQGRPIPSKPDFVSSPSDKNSAQRRSESAEPAMHFSPARSSKMGNDWSNYKAEAPTLPSGITGKHVVSKETRPHATTALSDETSQGFSRPTVTPTKQSSKLGSNGIYHNRDSGFFGIHGTSSIQSEKEAPPVRTEVENSIAHKSSGQQIPSFQVADISSSSQNKAHEHRQTASGINQQEPKAKVESSSTFERQVLRSIVDEALQDFKMQVHQEIQDLHLEIIRQTHLHEVALKRLAEAVESRDEKERQIQLLTEEIKRLKAFY